MSFGFSVGDFLAVGQLALTLYNECVGAPEEFQELARDLSSIHTVLSSLESQASDPSSPLQKNGGDRRPEWLQIKENLEGTLVELQDLINKYQNMGKNAWLRARLGLKDLSDLRGKLSVHLNAINTFIGSLTLSALGRMEPVLGRIETLLKSSVREERAGEKEPSVLKVIETNDEPAWRQIKLDLVLGGISQEELEKHEGRVKELLSWISNNESGLAGLEEVGVAGSISQQGSLHSEGIESPDGNRSSMKTWDVPGDIIQPKMEYEVKILIIDDELGRECSTSPTYLRLQPLTQYRFRCYV